MDDPFAAVAATVLQEGGEQPSHILLKLKAPRKERKRRVRFAADVIDNEDLCRKKSKNCCVFHRSQPRDGPEDEEDEETGNDDEAAAESSTPSPEGL